MRRGSAFLTVVVMCTPVWAQHVVSARAGMIHYLEGRVSVDDKRVRLKFARFPQMSNGQTLSTAQRARAELLLNPTTFLRVGESSSIKLLSDDLLDTRVALITGTAVVDVRDLNNNNKVTLEIEGSAIELRKDGVYHFTTGRMRVYDGEAFLEPVKLTRGWQVDLSSPAPQAEKFDRDVTDSLYLWSQQRARALDPPPRLRRRVSSPPWVFRPLGQNIW